MNSWSSSSATSARTVRAMMPMGITDMVMAGKIMNCTCSQSHAQSPDPPGPAPVAGNHISCDENTMTITMPSQ
ncbi:hypothetical protein D3C72_2113220 [compost metagenome]